MKSAQSIRSTIAKKSLHAGIHAANAVKNSGGNRSKQDTAAIYARHLVEQGKTGATAVENGYRVGMGKAILA